MVTKPKPSTYVTCHMMRLSYWMYQLIYWCLSILNIKISLCKIFLYVPYDYPQRNPIKPECFIETVLNLCPYIYLINWLDNILSSIIKLEIRFYQIVPRDWPIVYFSHLWKPGLRQWHVGAVLKFTKKWFPMARITTSILCLIWPRAFFKMCPWFSLEYWYNTINWLCYKI